MPDDTTQAPLNWGGYMSDNSDQSQPSADPLTQMIQNMPSGQSQQYQAPTIQTGQPQQQAPMWQQMLKQFGIGMQGLSQQRQQQASKVSQPAVASKYSQTQSNRQQSMNNIALGFAKLMGFGSNTMQQAQQNNPDVATSAPLNTNAFADNSENPGDDSSGS